MPGKVKAATLNVSGKGKNSEDLELNDINWRCELLLAQGCEI